MQRKHFVNIAGGIAAIFAVASLAAGPRAQLPIDLEDLQAEAEQRFASADTNGDGAVSAAEFAVLDTRQAFGDRRGFRNAMRGKPRPRLGRTEQFDVADQNGDGQLSKQEFEDLPQAVRAQRQQLLFARLDENDDGKLMPDEFPSMATRLARFDENEDGQITRDEMPRRRPRAR